LPPNLAFHLYIHEAAIFVELRTLESSNPADEHHSGFNFRNTLAVALGASRTPNHDEANKIFTFRGHDVKVKEKIRVESQDPSLIAAMAKLNALEHNVALSRKALDIVMDNTED
jgi:hypothetical protein